MSEHPPKNPIFDKAPGSPTAPKPDTTEKDRVAKIQELLRQMVSRQHDKGRAQQFLPYVMVRSTVGDHGNRPINVPFWESPDIWTAPGDPSTSPAIPASPGGTVHAGVANTVYAHVWNLGRAPIAGVKVEFYWFNPSLGIDGAHAHLIGQARVDLAPRSSSACHKLVKCPRAWTPVLENNGHECLVVRVSAIGDSIGSSHPWDSWANRHVAQRNISVLPAGHAFDATLSKLADTRLKGTRLQLLQLGTEGKLAAQLVAPRLALDPRVHTQVLAELRADNSLVLPSAVPVVLGAGAAPAHPAATAVAPAHPNVASAPVAVAHDALALPRIVPSAVLGAVSIPAVDARAVVAAPGVHPQGHVEVLHSGGSLDALINHTAFLTPALQAKLQALSPPPAGQVQVMRIAQYRGDQLIGGYTIVTTAK
ncbi:MAG TPA: hypothetical protein VF516_00710 [Kofleriaceae bacterium]